MKRVLLMYFLMAILGIYSCSEGNNGEFINDKNEVEEEPEIPKTPEQIFEETILSSLSDTIGLQLINKTNVFIEDSCLLVYGNKDKKLWFGIFEPNTLKNEWTWTSNEDYFCIHKEHIGYGDSIEINIEYSDITPVKIVDKKNFILRLEGYGTEVPSLYYLLFASDSKEKWHTINTSTKLKEWYDNTIISYILCDEYTIFSPKGEIISIGIERCDLDDDITPISMDEGIAISYFTKMFYRTNISTGIRAWGIDYCYYLNIKKDAKVKFDKTKEENNEWFYTMNVTNKDGSKETRNIKIDINDGTITQIN